MARYLDKYTGILKSLKPVHFIYNFLNRDKLKHNHSLYQKFGLRKSIYESIGSHDFGKHNPDIPWIDRPDALQNILQDVDYQRFTKEIQEQITHFVENGYLILRGWLPSEKVDIVNEEVNKLLQSKEADFNFSGKKIMMAHELSPVIDATFRQAELLEILNFLLGRKVIPFQTINFIEGSEQRPHSDSIHMTTEPQGYLIAAWWAFEDCHAGNGPLVYYPKSHRLPFVMSTDYASGNTKWAIGLDNHKQYEDAIASVIEKNNLQPHYFHAQKGDVFLWHANLIHGGTKITEKGAARRSMVGHYFGENVICFHELSQRPALIGRF